jgi:hypothetical protein
MALLTLIFALIASPAFADSPAAEKQPLNLEAGLGVGYARGENGLPPGSVRGMFSVILGYHLNGWMLGITTRGAYSTEGPTQIQTSQALESGGIKHRTIEYGLVARHYVTELWYAQIAGGIGYNEGLTGDDHLTPNPTPYFDRFYLDGTWLQVAVGKEFQDSPWFVRAEYTYSFYYHSKIVGTDEGVNRVIEENNLTNRPHEHIITFVVGLANLF